MAIVLQDIRPLPLSFLRGAIQVLLLGGFVAFLALRNRGNSYLPKWRPTWRHLALLAGLGLLGGTFNVGQAIAVELSGPSVAAVVGTQYPVVAVLLAPIVLSERLSRRRLGAVAVTSLGVVLVAVPLVDDTLRLAGLIVAALSAIAFGAYLVLARRVMLRNPIPSMAPTLAVFIGVSVLSAPAVLATDQPYAGIDGTSAVALAWLVIAAGIVPLALVEVALRGTPALRLSPFLFLTPVVAAVLGVLLLGDGLTMVQLLGTALAVAGVAWASGEREQPERAPAAFAR